MLEQLTDLTPKYKIVGGTLLQIRNIRLLFT